MMSATSALLIATGAALGLSVPLGKLAVANGVAPLSFVIVPALVAGLVLVAIACWRHGVPSGRRHLLVYGLVTGTLSNAVPNTLTAWVSGHAGANVTAIAYTLPPLFTLGFALLLGMERARWQRLLAVALGLVGALSLVGTRMLGGELSASAGLCLLAIPAVVGAGNIYRARYLPRAVAAEWLGAAMSLGAFIVLLPVWLLGPASASALSPAGLPYLAAQVANAVLAVVLFFQLQRRADPVTMSFIGYVLAITAVLLSTLLLGENLPWQLLPSALLIVIGFRLIQANPTEPLRPPAGAAVGIKSAELPVRRARQI
jgi:drug/metabolite transporter (DMT)-like permease